jgi:hypothetical protein
MLFDGGHKAGWVYQLAVRQHVVGVREMVKRKRGLHRVGAALPLDAYNRRAD